MDTSGIEPDPSRKFSEMLSERDNQLHHVPLLLTSFLFQHSRTGRSATYEDQSGPW